MKRHFFLVLVLAAASALLVSCEPMDVVDPFGLVHDDDSESSGSSLSGAWTGRSGSGQWQTSMNLSVKGSSVSGSITWHITNDTRSVSGKQTGSSIVLNIGGGDVWHLVQTGDTLSGHGDKFGTNRKYKLSFQRL